MATACPENLDALLTDFVDQARSYADDSDDSDAADKLALILMFGVSLAITIDVIDVNWRRAVLGKGEEYDPDQEAEILSHYRAWMLGAGGVVMHLERLEAGGAMVKWADQFRRAYGDAKGVLTPDDQFFSGDALVRMRDDAIDAHRAGRAEPYYGQGKSN